MYVFLRRMTSMTTMELRELAEEEMMQSFSGM